MWSIFFSQLLQQARRRRLHIPHLPVSDPGARRPRRPRQRRVHSRRQDGAVHPLPPRRARRARGPDRRPQPGQGLQRLRGQAVHGQEGGQRRIQEGRRLLQVGLSLLVHQVRGLVKFQSAVACPFRLGFDWNFHQTMCQKPSVALHECNRHIDIRNNDEILS